MKKLHRFIALLVIITMAAGISVYGNVPLGSPTPVSEIHAEMFPAGSQQQIDYCHVLNVRSGPGTSHPAFTHLLRGDIVTVLDFSRGWVRIETPYGEGWIFAGFLSREMTVVTETAGIIEEVLEIEVVVEKPAIEEIAIEENIVDQYGLEEIAVEENVVEQVLVNDFQVASANGIPIFASDIQYLLLHAETSLFSRHFEETGEFNFDLDFEDRAVLEEAVSFAAFTVIALDKASRLGISFSSDDVEIIDFQIESLVQQFGTEGLEELLWADGFHGIDHFRGIYKEQFIVENLIRAIMEDESEFANFAHLLAEEEDMPEEELLAAKHILLSLESFESEAAAIDFANTLIVRIAAGEDFDELVMEYGEDPGMWAQPEGYTFVAGVMIDEFYEATKALEIGQISGPVPSVFGIHIIQRVQPDEDNVMRMPGAPESRTLEDRMIEAIMLGLLEMVEQATIEFLPALDDVIFPEGALL